MEGSYLPIVVAHGEGRAQFVDEAQRDAPRVAGQVAMRFIDHDLQTAAAYQRTLWLARVLRGSVMRTVGSRS